ncbi:MAG: hypothetical protein NTV51_04700, partial [Verrucomicrobia bacterium]|nr:hypothetical protein [Verrucomicrobiota bacterium]
MSLINEALKKAQRNRSADPAGTLPPMPGGGRVSKRSQPRTSQQLILIAAGAIALVVLSVVATVYLVNRPPETKPAAPAPTPSAAAPVAVTPAVSLPVIAPKPIPEPPAAT